MPNSLPPDNWWALLVVAALTIAAPLVAHFL